MEHLDQSLLLHYVEEQPSQEALAALAHALVLAIGGTPLDEALQIAHDLPAANHSRSMQCHSLHSEAAKLREQLQELEQQLRDLAA